MKDKWNLTLEERFNTQGSHTILRNYLEIGMITKEQHKTMKSMVNASPEDLELVVELIKAREEEYKEKRRQWKE